MRFGQSMSKDRRRSKGVRERVYGRVEGCGESVSLEVGLMAVMDETFYRL